MKKLRGGFKYGIQIVSGFGRLRRLGWLLRAVVEWHMVLLHAFTFFCYGKGSYAPHAHLSCLNLKGTA